MKKIYNLLLVVYVCGFVIVGCGNESKESVVNESADETTEFVEFEWPNSDIAQLLPIPESNIGEILWETSEGLVVSVGETSKKQYETYVDACAEKGFVVDYNKGEDYYYAFNDAGYDLTLNFDIDNIMFVQLDAPGVEIKSDALPEMWYGEWTCVYSEAPYFKEGETIFIKDFDNAVIYTEIIGDRTNENNRWFCYIADESLFHVFNEPPPFATDGWIRETFEIKKESEKELVFTRKDVGQEVRFEKVDDISDTISGN